MARPLKLLGAVIVGLMLNTPLMAQTPATIAGAVPDAREKGRASFRYLGFALYDGRLFTPGGTAFNWQSPVALELTYRRSFDRAQLIGSTIQELERLEGKRADHKAIAAELTRCYRDVSKGEKIAAIKTTSNDLAFTVNGRQTCTLNRAGFANRFLAIFLSDKSRSPALSKKLRGQ